LGAFDYSALDASGHTQKGVLEGDTARQIRSRLRDSGLTPLSVEPVVKKSAAGRHRRRAQGGVSAGDLALATRQLATLAGSGLVLEEALQAVARQTGRKRLKSILHAARSRVMEGHTLASALGEFPEVFSDLYRATVAAGEQSGRLERVLERLADYTESRQRLNQKITLALFYPVLLSVVAIGVVIALLAYVVPQVVQVFENIGQQLPLLTRLLIATSDFVAGYGVLMLVAAIVALAGGRYVLGFEKPRLQFHRFLLRLPLVGRLITGLNTVRFTRTLGTMLDAGVPILEAFEVAGAVVTLLPMKYAIRVAAVRIREGAGVAESLARDELFPPVTVHLIASGESSGNLEAMLDRAADNQEQQLETLIGMFLGVFEPLLILLMGGLVLVIVVAILLPVFELNQLVK